jgi:hypothetical protein
MPVGQPGPARVGGCRLNRPGLTGVTESPTGIAATAGPASEAAARPGPGVIIIGPMPPSDGGGREPPAGRPPSGTVAGGRGPGPRPPGLSPSGGRSESRQTLTGSTVLPMTVPCPAGPAWPRAGPGNARREFESLASPINHPGPTRRVTPPAAAARPGYLGSD